MIETIAMRAKKVSMFLRARTHDGMLGTAGVNTGQGTGTPLEAAFAGFTGLVGVDIGAAGDEMAWILDVATELSWWDLTKDIQAQVVFQHQSTDADTPIFIANIKGYADLAALSDPDTTPDGTITWPAHTCSTTANSTEKTSILGFKTSSGAFASDELVVVNLECDNLGGAATNEITVFGLRLWGTLAMTNAPPVARSLT